MISMKRFMAAGILINLLFQVNNVSGQEKTYRENIIDGIRHVHSISPLWKYKKGIELKFVQKYGELESENDNLLLFNPGDIDVDNEGNVYIVDNRNHRIQKFDSNGKYLLTIGRRGQGPGEFEYPSGVYIAGSGKIFVNSFHRVTVYESTGKYIKSFPKRTLRRGMSSSGAFRMLKNGQYVSFGPSSMTFEEFRSADSLDFSRMPLFRILNSSWEEVASYGKKQHFFKNYSDNRTYNFCEIAVDSKGNYFIAKEAQNSIEKYAPDGTLLFKASRKSKLKESKKIIRKKAKRNAYAPMFNRFSNSIYIDGKDRLWVETYLRQYTVEERLRSFRTLEVPGFMCYEVYDNNGILLQRIPWKYGKGRRLKHIEGDRLFFVSWNDMCVYEYWMTDTNN